MRPTYPILIGASYYLESSVPSVYSVVNQKFQMMKPPTIHV